MVDRDPSASGGFGGIDRPYAITFEVCRNVGTRTATLFIAIHSDGVPVMERDKRKGAHGSVRQGETTGLGRVFPPIAPNGVRGSGLETATAIGRADGIDDAPLAKQGGVSRPERIA